VTNGQSDPPEHIKSSDALHVDDRQHETVAAEAELVDESETAVPSDVEHDDVEHDDVGTNGAPAPMLAVGIEADDPTIAPTELDETGPRYPGDTGVRYDRARTERPSWRETNMLTIVLALAALLVGGAIAALVVTLSGGDSSTELGEQIRLGSSLPDVAQSGPDPASGVPAPAISGTDLDGNALSVANDGRPHVLLVLAHWCPHCQAAVPQLVKLNEQKVMSGISFYAIVSAITPEGDNYPPSEWLRRENWPFPTFLDNADNQIARALGVTAFPFYVFVDADGNVVLRLAGDLDDAQLTALFKAHANGQRLPVTVGGGSSQSGSQPAPATTGAPTTTTGRR
jgi:thiol-disulfide isomerase/thioredoxin